MSVPGFWSSAIISAMQSRSASRGSEGILFWSSLIAWMICSAPCRVVGRNTGTGTWTGQINNHTTVISRCLLINSNIITSSCLDLYA